MRKTTNDQQDMNLDRRLLDEHQEDLPVPMTHDEFIDRARQLVSISEQEAMTDKELADARDKHKGRRMSLRERRVELEEAIRTGCESRPVTVQTWADYSTDRVRVIRADNGKLLYERELAPGERQRGFDWGGDEVSEPGGAAL